MSLLPERFLTQLTQETLAVGAPDETIFGLFSQAKNPQQQPAPLEPKLVDAAKPLSSSLLWDLQTQYYSEGGISAWDEAVPFLVTNSTYIADSYGDMIVAFIRDALPSLDLEKPLYIMEVSAGTGRFAYLLLRELERKLKHFPTLQNLDIRYVMTDITEKNIQFWQAHEKLKPFVDQGRLDFALYRPLDEQDIHLQVSGQTLSPESFANPLLVIANYLFDTIRHDLFRLSENGLEERVISLYRKAEYANSSQPLKIEEIETQVESRPLAEPAYYADSRWNALLDEYVRTGQKGNFIFPLGALQCIKHWEALSGNNLALFTSDKGYADLEQMIGLAEHNFAAHGAFSFSVNFDALDRYFRNMQGHVFRTTQKSLKLHTACYFALQTDIPHFENTGLVFSEKLDRSCPIISLLEVDTLTMFYEPQVANRFTIDIMLGAVRLSLYEPHIFCHCAPKLIDALCMVNYPQTLDILDMLEKTWENYYFFKGEVRLSFWISQVYLTLGFHADALKFLQETEKLFGKHESLSYLMGECLDSLQRKTEARHCYKAALAINPNFTEAKMRLKELNA